MLYASRQVETCIHYEDANREADGPSFNQSMLFQVLQFQWMCRNEGITVSAVQEFTSIDSCRGAEYFPLDGEWMSLSLETVVVSVMT